MDALLPLPIAEAFAEAAPGPVPMRAVPGATCTATWFAAGPLRFGAPSLSTGFDKVARASPATFMITAWLHACIPAGRHVASVASFGPEGGAP